LLKPEVLLLDEPVSALDPVSRKVVEKVTEDLNKGGLTIIMISHAHFVPEQVTVRRLALDSGSFRESNCHLEEGPR
jgi:ABC-type polar amino acid transport system ATPase subunit